MKILFSVMVLKGIGGIESSLLNLLNNISGESNSVELCVIGNFISENTKLPENVHIIKGNRLIEFCCTEYSDMKKYLPKSMLIVAAGVKLLKRIIGYRKILKFSLKFMKNSTYYDVAISYSNDKYIGVYAGGCDDYIMRCVQAKRKIAWIHNDARQHGLTHDICLKKYATFDAIVNVSDGCKKIFDEIVPEYTEKSRVVTNMLCYDAIEKKMTNESPFDAVKFNIVTVARIENRQKRIDRVIDCCKLLKKSSIQGIKWTVVGNGEDYQKLVQCAHQEGLDEYLEFVGQKNNTIPYMQHADLFVQTSDYEAYSMVLIEALSVGCPCLCTDYESASNIIDDEINGWLVPKASQDIYNKIIWLLENREKLELVASRCSSSGRKLNQKAMESFMSILEENNA